MNASAQNVRLAREILSRLNQLSVPNTAAVRAVRREFSHRIADMPPESVVKLTLMLLTSGSDLLRFFSYELVNRHRPTLDQLTADDLLKLGKGINSWASVDCFAMYLSGPSWGKGRVSDKTIATWARSQDCWWRRAALVSTVTLSRRGTSEDLRRATSICALLVADREDTVVKALSWALREIAKKHPKEARSFLAEHGHALAARVLREVNNKLKTGVKTPRRRAIKA